MSDALPINTWDQVANGDVVISYYANHGPGISSYTCVWKKGVNIDPNGPWYYHGNKGFSGIRKESLPLAKAWAEKEFGITKWKRNSMGDYIDGNKPYKPLRKS